MPAALVAVVVVLVGTLGPRAADLLDADAAGGRGRLDEWALAVAVVADHPVVGTGPEGYRIAAPAHVDDAYARRHGRDEVIDRAHSGPLDVATVGGLPAAGLYVLLLGLVVLSCVRVVRSPRDPVVAGMAVGVVAWVVQQLTSFPIAEVDPAAWLLAGVVTVAVPRLDEPEVIGREDRDLSPQAQKNATCRLGSWPGRRPRPGWWVGAGPVTAAVVGCVLAVSGVLAVQADRELQRAAEGQGRGSGLAAVRAADRATDLRPDDIDAWYVAARVAASRTGLLAVDSGLDRVEEGLRRSPHDPALRDLEEALLAERALRSLLPADLQAAEEASRALLADDPAGPVHHRRLGQVLAAQGDEEGATRAFRRALDLDPDDGVARAALDLLRTGDR